MSEVVGSTGSSNGGRPRTRRSPVDALLGTKKIAGGLTLADVATGALTTEQLAQVCRVLPMHVEGWAKNGWLASQVEADGTVLYRTTCIPLIEAMLEMAEYVKDASTLRADLAYLSEQMDDLWTRAVAADFLGDTLPVAQRELARVTVAVEGREVELTFLQRALARLRDLSPAA